MANPIYAPQGESTSEWLMKLLVAKQQQEVQKEQQNLQKKDLELRQAKFQQEQAEDQMQQQGVLQNFLQAAQDPSMGQMVQPAMQALGNANIPTPMAMGEVNRVAAPQDMGQGRQGPSMIDQMRQKQFKAQLDRRLIDTLGEDGAKEIQMGNLVYEQALASSGDDEFARKQAEPFVRPTAKAAAETAEINLRIQTAKTKAEGGLIAQAALKEKYGIDMVPDEAARLWADIEKNDRVYAQNRELTRMREAGANSRALMAKQSSMVQTLSNNFSKNETVTAAAVAARGYAKIKELGARITATNKKLPGHDHIALMDAFVRLATGTVVREQQVKLIKNARSLPEGVRVHLDNWFKKGGAVLSEEQVKNIISAADAMIEPYKNQVGDVVTVFTRQAELNGVDPQLFITDPFTAIPAQYRESPAQRAARLRQQGGK
jgi:hypothetical protein